MREGLQVAGDEDAPLDDELLAEFLEAVEAGAGKDWRPPSQAALEEVAELVERARPAALREVQRRAVLRRLNVLMAERPLLSEREAAGIVHRATGVPAETIRGWAQARKRNRRA